MSTGNADPDIPPEVLARMSASKPLSVQAAEDLGKPYTDDPLGLNKTVKTAVMRKKPGRKPGRKASKDAAIAESAEVDITDAAEYVDPLKGMTRDQVDAVRSKNYPGQPKMDPMLGDMTPDFQKWLWANHPKDAAIRYYARV